MPRFVLEHTTKKKTKHVTVDADRILIGRSPRAEIPLADTGVSKEHTLIERSGDGFVFVDLKSSNGTIHNGQRKDRGTLAHEDVLLVGRIRITVLLETAEKLQDDVVSEPTDARESAADPDDAELGKPLFANDEDPAPSHPDTGITKVASTRASIPASIQEAKTGRATSRRARLVVALAVLALIGIGVGAAFISGDFFSARGDKNAFSPAAKKAETPGERVTEVVEVPAVVPVGFPGLVEDPAGAYADGEESLRILYRLFLDVLRRPPTRAELEEWGDRDHMDRWRFLRRMRGAGDRPLGIGETFLRFLSREPRERELEAMRSWRPERFADLGLWITSTSEYRAEGFRRDRDIQQLSRSLFVDLLDREPSPEEVSIVEQAVLEADGLADVARILSVRAPARKTGSRGEGEDGGPDRRQTWLRSETFRFLLREVSEKELKGLLDRVNSPDQERWLRVVLAATPDYRNY